jgi:hypothetical protein
LKVNSLYWPQHQGEKMARQIAFVTSIQGLSVFAWASLDQIASYLSRPVHWLGPLAWIEMYLTYKHEVLIQLALGVALVLDLICFGPRLVAGAWTKKAMAVLIFATLAVTALFLGYTTWLVLYLTEAVPEASEIPGFQSRYMFPATIMCLFVPLALLEEPAGNSEVRPRALVFSVVQGLALGLLPFLMLASQVELVTDLLIRYW